MDQHIATDGRLADPAIEWGHRAHLDGLRTVAVYSVVAYHGGLGLLSGGFVGVDLFFVLSGYLVTMVILGDLHQSGTVRLMRFYSRRARRLIPAAAAVVVATAGAAVLISSPIDRADMVGDAQASSLWYANWHFISEANDYFAADGAESPFIHFWSLSIEEQFYLAFPLLVLGVWRLTRSLTTLMAVVSLGFTASVSSQIYWASEDANRAYLGTDARVYQIFAGSLLAMVFWRWNTSRHVSGSIAARRAVDVAAIAALVAFLTTATSALESSASTRGLLATVFAVTLISSLETHRSGSLARLLSLRPVAYLGQISYGTYLWHWPVLVFMLALVDMPAVVATSLAALIGTALAALSSELIEMPIRRRGALDSAPRLVIVGGVCTAVVTGLVVAPALLELDRRPVMVANSSGVESSDPTPVPALDWAAIEEDRPELPDCSQDDGGDCFLVEGSAGTVLMIGDSHARMMIPAFAALAHQMDLSLAIDYSPSCPWQRNLQAAGAQDRFTAQCIDARARTYDSIIPALRPDLVIAAGFPLQFDGSDGALTDRPDWEGLSSPDLIRTATETSAAAVVDEGARLLILEPFPLLESNPLSCLSAATEVEQCIVAARPATAEDEIARDIAMSDAHVGSLDLDQASCPQLPMCDPMIGTFVVRRDAHHLTSAFAESLVPIIRPEFLAALG